MSLGGATNALLLARHFDLGMQCRDYMAHCAMLRPNATLDPHSRVILGGLLAKLVKLCDGYLFLLADDRPWTADVLFRPLIETGVDLQYMLLGNNSELAKRFIRASLAFEVRVEKELEVDRQLAHLDSSERNEIRALIASTFTNAGGKPSEPASVIENWSDPTRIRDRAKATNNEELYHFWYQLGSSVIHSSYRDIESFHLMCNESGEVVPNIWESKSPSAKIKLISLICMDSAIEYVERLMQGEPSHRELHGRGVNLFRWVAALPETLTESLRNAQGPIH